MSDDPHSPEASYGARAQALFEDIQTLVAGHNLGVVVEALTLSIAASLAFGCESIQEAETKAERCPAAVMYFVRTHWDEWYRRRVEAGHPQTRA